MNSCASFDRGAGPSGFSLLELLVATSISAILLVVLASSIHSATDVWTRHDRRVGMARESRAALDSLQNDLGNFFAIPNIPDSTADDSWPRFMIDVGNGDLASSRLFFLVSTRQPNRDKGLPDLGNVRLVMYAVGFTQDANGRRTQKLFRKMLSPSETQSRLTLMMTAGMPLIQDTEWASIQGGQEGAEPVAYDVLRFHCQPLLGLTSLASKPTTVNGLGPQVGTWPQTSRPAAVDITLRVVSHRTSSQLQTEEDWRAGGPNAHLLLGSPPTPLDYSDDPEVVTSKIRVVLP